LKEVAMTVAKALPKEMIGEHELLKDFPKQQLE